MPGAAVTARTLPFRIAPVEGEAVDSWLEAISFRHDAPFGDVLRRCGIHPQTLRDTWLIGPRPSDFVRLAYITGIEPTVLNDMTMARYTHVALNVGRGAGRPRPSAWDWRATSRLCPECLADTDGRWHIAWRLNWSFACVKHHRLLADRCPNCDGLQRHQPHSTLRVPAPKRCARTRHQTDSGDWRPCLADLTNAVAPELANVQAVVQAQRDIDCLLDGKPTDLPLYGDSPPHPRDVLNDVKIIARWVISAVQLDQLTRHAPAGVVESLAPLRAQPMGENHRTNPTVAQVATGIAMALKVLSAPDTKSAAHLLQELMTAESRCRTGKVAGRASLSPVVRVVCDRARVSDEL
jgi:TniQ